MNNFVNALIADSISSFIPEESDYYGKLIGTWDGVWIEKTREIKGKWIFSRVLQGSAIQDVFIFPSREEVKINPQPDSEYGTTLRFYNPSTKSWDIYYGCTGSHQRLEAVKEGNSIVQTEITEKRLKWIFSDITENSFKWEKYMCDDNNKWELKATIYAKRKE